MEDPHTAVEVGAMKDVEAEEEYESDDTVDKEKLAVTAEEEEEDLGLLFSSATRDMMYKGVTMVLALLLVAYLLAAFIIDFQRATALFVCTVLGGAWNLYAYWAKNNEEFVLAKEESLVNFFEKVDTEWKYSLAFGGFLTAIMVIIMAATVRDGRNMVSLLGLVVFVGLTWLFSWKPKKVKFRPVLGGIFIQFIFGYVVIRTQWGFDAIEFLADVFTTLLGYTVAGSSFVFDWLTNGSLFGRPFQLVDGTAFTLGPPFFFNVLPSVIFFSALMSVGYYIRVIPWLVKKLGTLPSLRGVFLVVLYMMHVD
jgi:pyrimidine nucleoside transport protein